MVGTIGYLYYKEKVATIDRYCDMTMKNKAMQIKMDILKHKKLNSLFNDVERFRIALYDRDYNPIVSTLTTQSIDFHQKNYIQQTSAFFISSFVKPIDGIKHVVIEDSKVSGEMRSLQSFVWKMILLASLFIAFIGYFLSRLLLNPVKQNFALLNRFMKDSAHELNTPVTALMMSANYLKKEYDEEMVDHMLMSAKMISEIYNSISYLAFHDLDIERKEWFNLAEQIRESVRYYQEIAANKEIRIETQLNEFSIYMDKNSTNKLLRNLIANAIKYSYTKKTILITLNENVLKIKDEGVGISEKNQQKIFQRYKRVQKKEAGGFGIGLDIVMGICQANKIKIKLKSKLKEGSIFILIFPN